MNILAALLGAVTMVAGLDLRTVQLWAQRLLTMTRP